jgi:flagellar hook-basal body complex protein FliE
MSETTISASAISAQKAYTQVQNRNVIDNVSDIYNQGVSFHHIVQKEFNRFANMTPKEILNHIQNIKSNKTLNNIEPSSVIDSTNVLRRILLKQEDVARKALINEASTVELLTATTEAKNLMDTAAKIRDKFLEAWNNFMQTSL